MHRRGIVRFFDTSLSASGNSPSEREDRALVPYAICQVLPRGVESADRCNHKRAAGSPQALLAVVREGRSVATCRLVTIELPGRIPQPTMTRAGMT